MKDLNKIAMYYLGYKNPDTLDEIEFEICGLKTLIASAEQRITILLQSLKLNEMANQNKLENAHETAIEEASSKDK